MHQKNTHKQKCMSQCDHANRCKWLVLLKHLTFTLFIWACPTFLATTYVNRTNSVHIYIFVTF